MSLFSTLFGERTARRPDPADHPADARTDAATQAPADADTAPRRRVQRVRHELRRRGVHVQRVTRPTPGFAAVTFGGESLADFVSLSFDDHVKFMFPGRDGQTVMRDYTPRRFDPAARTLTLEFALHGHGEAAAWAAQATVGQVATIGGPRGSMIIPTDYDWHLLVGDASALPAISRRVEELPAGSRAIVRVLLPHASDHRPFDGCAADIDAQWFTDAAAWLQCLREQPLPTGPQGEGFAWAAGEAHQMAHVRQLWLQQHRLPKEAMRVSAYWKTGAADFHEHLA